jgi:hypothetical protein
MFLFCSAPKIKKKAVLGKKFGPEGAPPQDGREPAKKSWLGWPSEICRLLFPCHTFLEAN